MPVHSENLDEYIKEIVPDYSSDPAAWDEGLYGEIEKARLEIKMKNQLLLIEHTANGDALWFLISATPAQKARALAQAIQEAS